MELHEKIKSQRLALGFTQQEVADSVFVTRQTISKWELGKSKPDLVSLKLLSELLQEDFLKTESGKESFDMNITMKDIFLTFLFGVLFLPVRWVVSFLRPKMNWISVKFGLIPITLIVFVLYMRSLTESAFIAIGLLLILGYYSMVSYYSSSERKEEE